MVLKTSESGEANRILTLYSLEYGKLRAMAYGSARPTSRKRGATQPFCRSRFFLVRGKELHRVDQAEALEYFPGIEEGVEQLGLAGYFAELLNGFTPEEVPNRPLYHLLVEALRLLRLAEPETLARAFEIRLLTLTGFSPELDHCVACSGPLPPGESSAFSPGAGGVLCPACRRGYGDASGILPGTLQTLRRLREGELGRVPTVRVSSVIRQELGRVLPEAVVFHLGYRPRALGFLGQVKKG